MLDFPRTHIAIGGVCVAVLYGLFVWDIKNGAESVMLAGLIACVLYQAYKMSPYTFLASQQVLSSNRHSSDATFSLLVSNVLLENRNATKYLEIVREADPDILFAAETRRQGGARGSGGEDRQSEKRGSVVCSRGYGVRSSHRYESI